MAMVFISKARETNGPLIIYFYFCLIGACSSVPFLILDFRMPEMGQWMILVLIGLTGLIAQVLINQGLQFCQAAEGSVILMSEVVFAGIAGFLIFRDPVTLHFLIGAFLIVGSGIGLTLLHRKP
jgi:drug/metabolite transporter (DMT)-like permease